jgi:hypothetical protein
VSLVVKSGSSSDRLRGPCVGLRGGGRVELGGSGEGSRAVGGAGEGPRERARGSSVCTGGCEAVWPIRSTSEMLYTRWWSTSGAASQSLHNWSQ